MRSVAIVLSLFTVLALGIPAQDDYKVEDLRGTVALDFHDVRFKKGESRVDFIGPGRKKGNVDYRVECWVLVDASKKENPRVLERSVEFPADKVKVDEDYVSFQGHFDSEAKTFTRPASPSLHCWARELPDWRGANKELTRNLTIGDIQTALGKANDGRNRLTIHLGKDNLARHQRKDTDNQIVGRPVKGDPHL